MADANPCPNCGAERPANAPEGLCPRCLLRQAMAGETHAPEGDPGTTSPAAVGPGHTHKTTQTDAEATRASTDATVGWTPDPTDGARDLPRGAVVRYFGDYEVLTELGRGGMGVVYRARQVSLNRPVALKMIKAGVLADDAELRRFQNEAEAVALLDHPGVVPVYEVGEHDGQRYFSMKLVEGGNLAERLVSFKDDPKAAATLLAETAEAVHHAHMRGILHRDLKPANILVDTEGHPHVTDFGLAKRVEAEIEMTATGVILGTPAYMSPEQAVGHRGAITTATDVYGLGAILYALLTSKPPFGGDGVMETLDAVRTRPPEPPTRLNARVPRDLETICLKCLEKDPRRRYSSAQALADDLHAWLDLRPITARRVGAAERAWLWCKRKPAVAALTAAVVLAAVGGAAAVIAVQAKANADLRAANTREAQRFDLANEAIKLFHGEVGDDLVLKDDQFKPLRDKLLRGAADFYGKLEGLLKSQPDRASRKAMGNAYSDLGHLTAKIGDKPEALAAHRKGLAVRRELASDLTASAEARDDVARSLSAAADLLNQTGKSAEAIAHYEEARDLIEGLPLSGPGTDKRRALLGSVYSGLGFALAPTGKSAGAMAAYQRSVGILTRLADDRPAVSDFRSRLANTHNNIGGLQSQTGKPLEAIESYRRALAVRQTLADDNPAVTEFRFQLADTYHNIGHLMLRTSNPVEGMESYRRALTIRQKLTDENPAVTEFRSRLSSSHNNIGALQGQSGRFPEALESFRRALAIRQKLTDENPTVTEFRGELAFTQDNIGTLLARTGKPVEALASHRGALAIRQELADDNPAVIGFRSGLAMSHTKVGILESETGKPVEALGSFRKAMAIQQKLADDNPEVSDFQSRLAASYNNIGTLQSKAGKPVEALESYRRALAIHKKLADDNPAVTDFRHDLALTRDNIGGVQLDIGKPVEALESYRQAVTIREKLADDNPDVTEFRSNLADSHTGVADVLRTLGRAAEAREGYGRAIEIREELVKATPNETMFRSGLAYTVRRLGLVRLATGDAAGAVADARRAAALFEGLSSRSGYEWCELACCHATLAGAAGREGSVISAGDGEAEADAAMGLLRRAAAEGYRNANSMAKEAALDPLRRRPDFRLLMMDLAMPADPFAP